MFTETLLIKGKNWEQPTHLLIIFLNDFIHLFLERQKGRRERTRETSMCGCLLHAPYWGPPGLQPRHVPLAGHRTSDPSVHRPALNPLSHTSQGLIIRELLIKNNSHWFANIYIIVSKQYCAVK